MDLSLYGTSTAYGPVATSRTLDRAAIAAEAQASRQSRGLDFRCCRGRGRVTVKDCVAGFRDSLPPCVNPQQGPCSRGMIEDAKQPKEDVMSTKYGKCANPDCPNKGRKMSLPAKGLCGVCYKKVLAGTMAWPPKAGQEETTAVPADVEAPEAVSGQDLGGAQNAENGQASHVHNPGSVDENLTPAGDPTRAQPFEEIIELPARQVEPQTAGVTAEAEGCRSDHTLPDSDLPENMDRPFSLAGFDFHPVPQRRMVGSHLAAITSKSLSLRTGVIHEHGLDHYTHARIAVSTDGKALAIKSYAEKRPGACKIQHKRKSGAVVAMEPLTAKHPEWIGREAPLEPMGVGGWFLMRVGEAA